MTQSAAPPEARTDTLPVGNGVRAASTAADAWIGRVLGGRYLVERLLGRGGMGLVFEARHVAVGRRVAVKILRPEFARSEEALARFHREARAAAAVGSAHIVEVLDFGRDEDGAYLVMELLEGRDLARVVREDGALAPSRAVAVARQVAEALAAAHARGIVHRDLKSGNVFVCGAGDDARVKVLDFGVSKVMAPDEGLSLDTAQGVVGTPHYMAPEQGTDGRSIDHRVDLYALGCILFEMLTGTLPFDGATPVEVLYKQVHEAPPRPSSRRRDVPRSLDALVLSLLAKSRDRRPPDAAAVLRALDAWQRQPRPPWALAALALVLVGATTWLVSLRPAASSRPVARRAPVARVVTSADAEAPRDAPGAPGIRADSERVVWTLVVRPAEATVTVDGRMTPTRDGVLVLREPRGATVTVRAEAPGRRARTQQVRVLDDDSQVWTLDEVTEPRPLRPPAVVRARVRDDAGVVAADVPAVVDGAAVRVVAPLDGLKTNPYDSGRRP